MCASIKNVDIPFTELFSFLRPLCSSNGETLAFDPDDLKLVKEHVNNSIEILLRGWQSLMEIFHLIKSDAHNLIGDVDLWSFFSSIGNLLEALNSFRSDIEYLLHRKVVLQIPSAVND